MGIMNFRRGKNVETHRKLSRAIGGCLEPLESRRMLTVTGSISGTQLNVIGDGANDQASIQVNSAGNIVVTSNSAPVITVSRALVNSIHVDLDGGNDTLIITDRVFPFLHEELTDVNLGTGTDQLELRTNGNAILVDGSMTTRAASAFQGTFSIVGEETINLFGGDSNEVLDGSGYTGPGLNISGFLGNDTLIAGSGALPTLAGGDGNDTIFGGSGNDRIIGGPGVNVVDGGTGGAQIRTNGNFNITLDASTLVGGTETTTFVNITSSFLEGGAGDNVIDASAFTGTSAINGGGGNDTLYGSLGTNTLQGQAGNDLVIGGPSDDNMSEFAGGGNDTLIGNGGNDRLDAGVGTVMMYGGPGNDEHIGRAGATTTVFIDATSGDDSIVVNVNPVSTSNSTVNINSGALVDRYRLITNMVIDAGDGIDTASVVGALNTNLTIKHLEPVVNGGADVTIPEGSTFSSVGSFTDPFDPTNAWTATVDYGDGSGVQPLTLNPDKTYVLNHSYTNEGVYNVVVTVSDGQTTGMDTVQVTVENAPPAVGPISGPSFGFVGQSLSFSALFEDAGVSDTHTATIDFGDGTIVPASVSESGGSGSASGSHAYATVGSFTVTLTVTDDAGASTSVTRTVDIGYGAIIISDKTTASSGSTIPLIIQLVDADGNNISSRTIEVKALRIESSTMEVYEVEDAGKSNPEDLFRYQASDQYIFNLKTTGLAAGTYTLFFKAVDEADGIEHGFEFTIV